MACKSRKQQSRRECDFLYPFPIPTYFAASDVPVQVPELLKPSTLLSLGNTLWTRKDFPRCLRRSLVIQIQETTGLSSVPVLIYNLSHPAASIRGQCQPRPLNFVTNNLDDRQTGLWVSLRVTWKWSGKCQRAGVPLTGTLTEEKGQ